MSGGKGAPGRPRTPRAVREREMLAAATDAFADRGYERASMDDIAARAGISKPMLYAYFGSKDGLYAACARQAAAQLVADIEAIGSRPDVAPDARLWRGLLAVFEFVEAHREGWSLLYPDGALSAGPLGEGGAHARDAMAALLARLFADAARERGVAGRALEFVDAVATAFTAATIAAASRWVRRPDEPKEVAAMVLMNMAWVGFRGMLEGDLWLPEEGT